MNECVCMVVCVWLCVYGYVCMVMCAVVCVWLCVYTVVCVWLCVYTDVYYWDCSTFSRW